RTSSRANVVSRPAIPLPRNSGLVPVCTMISVPSRRQYSIAETTAASRRARYRDERSSWANSRRSRSSARIADLASRAGQAALQALPYRRPFGAEHRVLDGVPPAPVGSDPVVPQHALLG